MTRAPDRLARALDVLTIAFTSYLEALRATWADHAENDLVRLLAGIGCSATAPDGATRAVAAATTHRAVQDDPLGSIVEALGLTTGEELLVAAAWHAEADPQFGTVLGCAHDDGARRFPTAALVRRVLEPFGIETPAAIGDHDALVHFGVILPAAGASAPVTLTPTARTLLARRHLAAPLAPAPLPLRLAGHVEQVAIAMQDPDAVVVVRGAPGSGRHALAHAAAGAAHLVLVRGDVAVPELRLLARATNAVPFLELEAENEFRWRAGDGRLALVATSGRQSLPPHALVFETGTPTVEERRQYWSTALAGEGMRARDSASLAETLAGRFAFTEGTIDRVVARARTDASAHHRAVDADLVWDATRRLSDHSLDRLATLVEPVFTLEDVVVPDDVRAQLDEIVDHVALQFAVLDRWNFRSRFPRGRGVAALFTGPPGTGKTMAAEALAGALHQDLYRVDLSAVVSKYIGETEKQLASAFDDAERIGAVLFFDEADALFGKRTEVRDAHDRYANLEVDYLLQRVEAFTGLLILASNRRSSLDEAFTRRLRFVVRFELPDRAARRELWCRSFPPESDCAPLDWDALAEAELSGATIQSAALRAAYRATRDGGRIEERHVAGALMREYEKLGKAFAGTFSGAGTNGSSS